MKRLPHYSQHFLKSPRLVKELVGHTSLKSNDSVIDIGAGSGVISSVLAKRCKEVIAVEFEPRTVELLRKNMERYPNVRVVEADIITMPLPAIPYKIFANIPFHLSSAIIRRFTEADNPPIDTYLIVQKQLANKLLPNHKGFSSQLGMIIGPWFAVRIRKRLKRTDFWPFPNVDTVLLQVQRRDEPLLTYEQSRNYGRFITENFTKPTIFAKTTHGKFDIPTGTKPSELTLTDWIGLFQSNYPER